MLLVAKGSVYLQYLMFCVCCFGVFGECCCCCCCCFLFPYILQSLNSPNLAAVVVETVFYSPNLAAVVVETVFFFFSCHCAVCLKACVTHSKMVAVSGYPDHRHMLLGCLESAASLSLPLFKIMNISKKHILEFYFYFRSKCRNKLASN